MERVFGDLIALRLVVGRLLANQAHASGDADAFLEDQLNQAKADLIQVNINAQSPEQEASLRAFAEMSLEDMFERINFAQ